MRSRRLALGALALPFAVLVAWGEPVWPEPPGPVAARPDPGKTAPRPQIVSRRDWGADEGLVREHATYTGAARVVFVHHTGHPNGYDCKDVPAMLRAMEVDHVRGQGWDDIGYNFVVDRCGTIYEGRGGGSGRPVHGAHTEGFNDDSVGVAALGDFGPGTTVPPAMLRGIAKVAAWKLRADIDPHGTVRLVSTNDDSRYPKGRAARFHAVSGHRDSQETRCPGDALYAQLPAIRDEAARLRDR
ncbi:peptidoglycan recognition protein family protein [Streptomyces meridianus]|uniref:Peptidoglycan recognition protein n=1 Tax=Streptomyces meridianus TaxID=2938945 RepID=A0ABT0X5V7_9ACTN|nr:peptidoglycan recognition protein [Streptomyces meridianus]MCM2577814.1 peptidoglycan recognition protein [Streptomyces meridianus]